MAFCSKCGAQVHDEAEICVSCGCRINNASSRVADDGKNLKEIPFGETYRHTEKITRYKIIYDFLY